LIYQEAEDTAKKKRTLVSFHVPWSGYGEEAVNLLCCWAGSVGEPCLKLRECLVYVGLFVTTLFVNAPSLKEMICGYLDMMNTP
jgi:hypothetical protein